MIFEGLVRAFGYGVGGGKEEDEEREEEGKSFLRKREFWRKNEKLKNEVKVCVCVCGGRGIHMGFGGIFCFIFC